MPCLALNFHGMPCLESLCHAFHFLALNFLALPSLTIIDLKGTFNMIFIKLIVCKNMVIFIVRDNLFSSEFNKK